MSLPDDTPAKKVTEWLCADVVPVACSIDPQAVARITDWLVSQVEEMEASGKPGWMPTAITLVNALLQSLKTSCQCSVDDLRELGEEVVQAKMSNNASLEPIHSLVRALRELEELNTKFKFHIPLYRLQKESKESLVFSMLSRVPSADLLPAALRSTVLPYIHSQRLAADEIFANYVEEKVRATLNLVKNVIFPLPEFVEELVEDVLTKIEHPLCDSLREQWTHKEASNIIWKSGFNPDDLKTPQHVLDCAKFIAYDQTISHAQKVLAAFSASQYKDKILIFACQLKVEHAQLDDLAEFLRNMPKQTAIKCCQFVMTTAKHLSVEGYPAALAEVKLDLESRSRSRTKALIAFMLQ
ncbi:kinetochore-associated protein 1-like [Elysia marginata]|uniref:Kinetochore-associated protein 1-like n=1 Tax=Elysia marginata TaxID=1093978 RepID=A0AAV4IXW6_9GAST|nr:kinetochore-associated protein 1-like [Elysia marginata]